MHTEWDFDESKTPLARRVDLTNSAGRTRTYNQFVNSELLYH